MKIAITDEQTEDIIKSTGLLDLASGEISRIEYQDYNVADRGLPWDNSDYEFTSGMLSNDGKDVEFRIDVDQVTGNYSVTATELLEIKVRAAALFAGLSGKDLLGSVEAKSKAGGGKAGRLH